MKQDLTDRIQEWRKASTVHKEFRSVKREESAIVDGEYTLNLKMAAKVTCISESEKIIVKREARTMGQSVSNEELDNPNADIQVFNSCGAASLAPAGN